MKFLAVFALIVFCSSSFAESAPAELPPAPGPATGLADSAALRATVFGTPPQDIAPLPDTVPMLEMEVALPWRQPVPQIFWFDKRLRVWFSAQKKPAPLAIVISGTGSDANTAKLSVLRAILYGAGYHVLTVPSPTFPGFIVSASSTGVAGDLMQDGHDLYAAMGADHRSLAAQGAHHRCRCARLQSRRSECGHRQIDRRHRAQAAHSSCGDDQPAGQPVRHDRPTRQALRGLAGQRRCRHRALLSAALCRSSPTPTAPAGGWRSTRISSWVPPPRC